VSLQYAASFWRPSSTSTLNPSDERMNTTYLHFLVQENMVQVSNTVRVLVLYINY
jgi:hypothetical protein